MRWGWEVPPAVTAAEGAFQEGPGYDYAVQQGLQGVMRNASSLGNIASGNTAMALQDRGNQLANQEYGGWLDRLSGYDPLAMHTAGAQAGISTGLGDRLLGLAGVTGWAWRLDAVAWCASRWRAPNAGTRGRVCRVMRRVRSAGRKQEMQWPQTPARDERGLHGCFQVVG